jgi:hypothetical protein
VYVFVYYIVHYVSYPSLILCLYTGALFHYNKDFTTYGVARHVVPLFQDDDDNPLINELGIYILDKLCMFQNMQDYAVTADTDIDNYVRECTLIVDGTKIYRFSKELLAYIEMCVTFSPYYRQDDPRTAGAMDTYFRDVLQTYADVTYKVLHDYLARRFHAWYAKFKPSSSAVVNAGDPELGTVVPVEGVDGAAAPAKRSKRPRFRLTLKDIRSGCGGSCGPFDNGRGSVEREIDRKIAPLSRTVLSRCAANKAAPTRRRGWHQTFDAQ